MTIISTCTYTQAKTFKVDQLLQWAVGRLLEREVWTTLEMTFSDKTHSIKYGQMGMHGLPVNKLTKPTMLVGIKDAQLSLPGRHVNQNTLQCTAEHTITEGTILS